MTMNYLPENAICIVDSHAGIYVPREFAREYSEAIVPGTVSQEDLDILEYGPDHEWYWEAWETVHDNAVLLNKIGTRYTLWQDEDLWAIPEGAEWPDDDFSTPNDYPYGEFGADSTHDRY